MSETIHRARYPILALRGITIFPDQTIHFDIGRVKSALALEHAMKHDQTLVLIPQKDILVDDPELIDLYPVGTLVSVKQILKSHTDNIRVLVTGLRRVKISELCQTAPFLSGYVEDAEEV